MKKENKRIENLKQVSLYNVRARTESSWKHQKNICYGQFISGNSCWNELDTPTVIKDIFANMTEAEFQTWLHRLYGETHIPA